MSQERKIGEQWIDEDGKEVQMTRKGPIKKGLWYTTDENGKPVERPEGWDPSQTTEEEWREMEEKTGMPLRSDSHVRSDDKAPDSGLAHTIRFMLQQMNELRQDFDNLCKRVEKLTIQVMDLLKEE